MPRRFKTGDNVWWDKGLTKKLDGTQERLFGNGKIITIENDFMFIQTPDIGHASAKKIKGRWLIMKSGHNYQLRIHHI